MIATMATMTVIGRFRAKTSGFMGSSGPIFQGEDIGSSQDLHGRRVGNTQEIVVGGIKIALAEGNPMACPHRWLLLISVCSILCAEPCQARPPDSGLDGWSVTEVGNFRVFHHN